MTEARKVSVKEMRSRRYCTEKSNVNAYSETVRSNPMTSYPEISADAPAEKSAVTPVTGHLVKIEAAPKQNEKLKVAAYCRVSTLYDSQESSITAQRKHYEEFIHANDEWEFAGIYIEAGVSGTKREKRPELQRLINDCKARRVDLILTKSISRFARNTSDCLQMVRDLSSLGVHIRFEKESIDTGTMDSEFLLSILACMAENESRSISDNMKWGIRKRFEAGTYKQPFAPYGYEYQGKTLVPVPETAGVVRRIFALVLSGSGMNTISKTLNEEAIPSPQGNRWTVAGLRSIIKNPAYTGDMLYQKTYKDGQFMQKKNRGELDQFLDANHHEPIISKADFDHAQEAVKQRAREVGYQEGSDSFRSKNQNCFSGILLCENCGSVMHRQIRDDAIVWLCYTHVKNRNVCDMRPQSEDDLKAAFINCLNKLAWAQKNCEESMRILDVYGAEIAEFKTDTKRLQEIEDKIEKNAVECQKLSTLIQRDGFLPEYAKKKVELERKADELAQERNAIFIIGSENEHLQELKKFIDSWTITDDINAFPDDLFHSAVQYCMVDSKVAVTFHFFCGLSLTESLVQEKVSEAENDENS